MYEVTTGAALVNVTAGGVVTAKTGVTASGNVVITVSLTGFAFTKTVAMNVVTLSDGGSIAAASSPFPSFAGSTAQNANTLNKIQCTEAGAYTRPHLCPT